MGNILLKLHLVVPNNLLIEMTKLILDLSHVSSVNVISSFMCRSDESTCVKDQKAEITMEIQLHCQT